MKILAIETSCDETAAAILDTVDVRHPYGRRTFIEPKFRILSNIVSSQIKIHKPFGGVVPHLAQREHQKNLPFILLQALREASFLNSKTKQPQITTLQEKEKLSFFSSLSLPRRGARGEVISSSAVSVLDTILAREPELLKLFQKHIFSLQSPPIDAIAVTYGPGLEPALWVGINFAKALSALWNKPLIPVNHLEGHIYASWLPSTIYPQPSFPLLALIVSGGHTELVLVKKHLDYKILGETRDDAAGEAFDKVAKMLGLGYPGGPEISRLAERGNPNSIKFPRPMIYSNNFDFSFSGLKTAVLYYLKGVGLPSGSPTPLSAKANVAASFEQAAVDVLVAKTSKALRQYSVKALIVGGGVAANKKLRASLEKLITNHYPRVTFHLSPLRFCGDNAAMIAAAAYFRSLQRQKSDVSKIRANGNLKLS